MDISTLGGSFVEVKSECAGDGVDELKYCEIFQRKQERTYREKARLEMHGALVVPVGSD